jgi:hypothetical protein
MDEENLVPKKNECSVFRSDWWKKEGTQRGRRERERRRRAPSAVTPAALGHGGDRERFLSSVRIWGGYIDMGLGLAGTETFLMGFGPPYGQSTPQEA